MVPSIANLHFFLNTYKVYNLSKKEIERKKNAVYNYSWGPFILDHRRRRRLRLNDDNFFDSSPYVLLTMMMINIIS
jgi:hypothetical protein